MTKELPFKNSPRMFALTLDEDGPAQVIGYGIELPDGSAYAVSWPTGHGSSFYSCESAEQSATLRGADLLWIAPSSDDPKRSR